MKRISIVVGAAALLFSAHARADVVLLNDGQELEGVVVEKGDEVQVRLEFGTVTFARSDVRAIERGDTKLHELEKRMGQLRVGDKRGTLTLAKWAAENGLADGARQLYRRVLAIDANDAEAHRALGHRQHEGRWMSEEDYLRATGKIRYGGRWVSEDEAKRLDAEAKVRRERAAERRKQEALAAETRRMKVKQQQLENRVEDLEADQSSGLNWGWNWWGVGATTRLNPYMNGFNVPRNARRQYRVGFGVRNWPRIRQNPRLFPKASPARPRPPARPAPASPR